MSRRLRYRVPLIIVAIEMSAIAFSACKLVAGDLCGETVWEHLRRAISASVASRGSTIFGLALAAIPSIWKGISKIRSIHHRGGLLEVKKDMIAKFVKEGGIVFLAVGGFIWCSLIVWQFVFIRPEVLSSSEVAKRIKGITVSINTPVSDGIAGKVLRSGFWADEHWIVSFSEDSDEKVEIGIPVLPYNGRQMVLAYGAMQSPAVVIQRDRETRAEILYASNNEMIRGGVSFVDGRNTVKVTPDNNRPCFSSNLPKSGDTVFASSMSSTNEVSFRQGNVIRQGVDIEASAKRVRFYISIPFSLEMRGAPVFDNSARIVGMIVGADDNSAGSVVLPTAYLKSALDRVK